jgi:DnaJ-class molecular chaperone
MNYFKDCKTQEDVKRLYREWAMKLHPDRGGTKEEMIELTRQYDAWKPSNKFSQSSTMDYKEFEEKFKKSQEAWGKEFESKAQYGGYGGYRYANVNDMTKEYFKQTNDPRLADYERMKRDTDCLNKRLMDKTVLCNDLHDENIKLKKKIVRLEKKLKQPPKAKKAGKDSAICL